MIDCEEDRTLRAVLVGMLREAARDAQGLKGLDGRTVASRWTASCVPVGPRLLGSTHPRFDPCRAAKGRGVGRHLPPSTCLAVADPGIQGSFRAPCSRIDYMTAFLELIDRA